VTQPTNPVKAIRAYCLDCSQTASEVAKCVIPDCPLYPFRMGRNPFRTARVLSEDQKEAARERFRLVREKSRAKTDSGDTP
jgi:hypothetical protein